MKRIFEYLNWPSEITSDDILQSLKRAGVPSVLCQGNFSLSLDQYMKKVPLLQQLEKTGHISDYNNGDNVASISVTLHLWYEIVECFRMDYSSITKFLVLFSVLSMHYANGIYYSELFDAISSVVEKIHDNDWATIASEWSEKFVKIMDGHIYSNQVQAFFDGCMQNYSNPRLLSWAKATMYSVLCSLKSPNTEIPPVNLSLGSSNVLKNVLDFVKNSSLFSTHTPSYIDSMLALFLVRHQIDRDCILESKVIFYDFLFLNYFF